jgi:hypothetical protein
MNRSAAVTFNVVFVPGTAEKLLPFTLSLLQQSTGARYRLVDNGGRASDQRLLRTASERFEHVSYFRTPGDSPIEHGAALNAAYQEFEEPYFAIIDSDVCASGEFLSELVPLPQGCAARFSASPVWAEDDDTVAASGCTWIGARQRTLHTGTVVGNTYCAVYDRAALETVWARAPLGFQVQDRYMLSPDVREDLAAQGWGFTTFDTSRLLNLLLLIEGATLENRQIATLHHVGGFSGVDRRRSTESPGELLARLVKVMQSGDEARSLRIWDGFRHRVFMYRSRRRPEHRAMNERRRLVSRHVDAVLRALSQGEPVPQRPEMGSPQIDARVEALQTTLEQMYGPNRDICRSLAL